MIIQCEKCNRKFKIDDSRITSAGSKVRCSKCGHVFFVEKKESAYEERGAHTGEESPLDAAESQTVSQEDLITPEVESGKDYDVLTDTDENNQSGEIGEDSPGEFEPHKLDEAETDNPFDSEDSTNTTTAEHQAHEYDVGDGPSRTEEPDPNIDKVTGEGGNWEEFVTISKNEEKTDDFKIQDVPAQTEENTGFSWDNLRIDNETDEVPERTPDMFEDEEAGPKYTGPDNARNDDKRPEETASRPPSERTGEPLSVDMGVLTDNPHTFKSPAAPSGQGPYGSMRTYPSKSKPGKGLFASIAYAVITIAVFAVIIVAAYVILLNMGIVSKESSDKLMKLAGSVVPIRLAEPIKNDVIIAEHSGKWMDTRNGSLYVISGMITNKSRNPVNFVKIRSEFFSAGQALYENEVYAGNTFTDNELKVSPLQDILLKLKKRNGDIDYYNTNKLAGLNYNIQPGESIPFYTVFPSTSRVLGLKYELQVSDYEDSSSK